MLTKKTIEPKEETKSPKASKPKETSECCSGYTSCASSSTSAAKSQPVTLPFSLESKKGPKTRIVIKYDVGFNNTITLRGKGANLNWDKGINLKNMKPDEWVWETDMSFTSCEFKVLINDNHYEIGNNHNVNCGASIQYTPKF